MKAISFSTDLVIEKEYYPQPASKFLPDWYKKLDSYISGKKEPNGNGTTTATIKKCVPVFDCITAGYIIVLPVDIYVSQRDNAPYYEWPNFHLVEFHPVQQAPTHPSMNNFPYPKFMNPWSIKTAPGYSSLFVQPFHRESVFTILPGIVDTDTYTAEVNFPFTLNNPQFEGLISAGTPIAQVIPIKRDVWQMEFRNNESNRTKIRLHSKMFDGYKNLFWHRKEYK